MEAEILAVYDGMSVDHSKKILRYVQIVAARSIADASGCVIGRVCECYHSSLDVRLVFKMYRSHLILCLHDDSCYSNRIVVS